MIIAISGKIGSGKDTVAKIIQYLTSESRDIMSYEEYQISQSKYRYDSTFEIKKFAGKLKQIVSLLTGIPVEDLEKQEVKDSYLGEEWDKVVENVTERFVGKQRDFDEFLENNKEAIVLSSINEFKNYQSGEDWVFSYRLKIQRTRMKVREMLQLLGTEALRNVIHPNVHVNALFADYIPEVYFMCDKCMKDNILKLYNDEYCPICKGKESEEDLTKVITDSSTNWLISDLRFPNEAEAIRSRGGINIRIERPIRHREGIYSNDDITKEDLRKVEERHIDEINRSKLAHPSETALDDYKGFKYKIINDGSIEDLVTRVKQILLSEGII